MKIEKCICYKINDRIFDSEGRAREYVREKLHEIIGDVIDQSSSDCDGNRQNLIGMFVTKYVVLYKEEIAELLNCLCQIDKQQGD